MSNRQPIGFTTPLAATPAEAVRFTRKLAWVVIALLAARMLLDAHMLWRDYQAVSLIRDVVAGSVQPGGISYDEADPERIEQLTFANLLTRQRYSLLLIPLPVLFLYFIYRARRNLELLDARDLAFSPGWAVGWFLIPFLNLIRPYAVMSELWRASDPDFLGAPAGRDPLEWRRAPVAGALLAWWMLLITAFFAQPAGMVLVGLGSNAPPEAVAHMLIPALWMQALALPAAALGIYTVHSLAARQQEKYERLEILRASPARSQ